MTVIGIVAVLIALLMPAMVRARQAAQSLVCQSNLRQIYQASVARSTEHRGVVQVAGNMNGIDVVTPATLGDPDEKLYAYYDDGGVRRPAPLQAALAPYLGVSGGLRSDSADHLLADIESGIIKRIFTCPSQEEPAPSLIIAGGEEKWFGPMVPSSYAFNEGVFGFVNASDHWMRGKLSKAQPASEIVFMSDALPRTEFGPGFIAWMPVRRGKLTLADALTNDNETYKCGVRSQFDFFRHHQKMNVVFCDGHTETLVMSSKELERGVLLPE